MRVVAGSGAGWKAAPYSSLLGYQRVGTAQQGPQDRPGGSRGAAVMSSRAGSEGQHVCEAQDPGSSVCWGRGHLAEWKRPVGRDPVLGLSGRL